MNTRRLLSLIVFAAVLLAGCAPAATAAPSPVAIAPKSSQGKPVYPTQNASPRGYAAATQAPAATSAPQAYAPAMPAPTQAYAPGTSALDNQFQAYGTNPYVDTRGDHLSTFALDVDTASYTVARSYIQGGSLPPQDAIRPEEFINFFDAGYTPPAQAAFALYAEGAPSPFYRDGSIVLRFGVQGYRVAESQRKPVALTFVIDISGSMGMENRLGLVKQALQILVDRLRPQDSVGVVVFGSDARVALPPTSIEDRDQILSAINRLSTEGSTNAEAGLRLGYEMAMQNFHPAATNKVIFCSDGVANTGLTNPNDILETIHGYIKEGITLNTYGFGMGNFNDALLEQLADHGDGMYAYIDSLDEAQRLFIDNLTGSLVTIAMNAKVQVDFNPDVVSSYRLIGYENRAVADQDFRDNTVDAGEIGAGYHVVALYAVHLQANASGRVSTVQLRWQDPKTSQVTEINGNLNTWDLKPDYGNMTSQYQLAVLAGQYAETLKGTPWARETDLWQMRDLAQSVSRQMPFDQDVAEFADLVSRAAQLMQDSRGY